VTSPQALVAGFAALATRGKSMLVPAAGTPRIHSPGDGSKVCVILSPHPDDECINGGLPLRLLREGGWRVVNLAVTHGSNPDRQLARARELQAACAVLGFENVLLAERGLMRVSAQTRVENPTHWQACVALVAGKLQALKPDLLMCPHPRDAQAAHVGTWHLAMDALARMPSEYAPLVAYTEYWSTMESPNLMLELREEDLADLLVALTQHVGEVSRNPYHMTVPAWMMDNVRRGAERVGLPGASAPDFTFAVLHQMQRWDGGQLRPAWSGGRFVSVQHVMEGVG
jgi:LmbE family N-acetylglucosaminyl deacetylase